MGATINIQQNEAKAWQERANALNERTEQLLKMVGACFETLNAESVGDFVDELVVTGVKLLDNGAQMIGAMNGLIDAVNNILSSLAQAVGEAVSNVVSNLVRNTTL